MKEREINIRSAGLPLMYILFSLLFIFFGVVHLTGTSIDTMSISRWGYPVWLRYAIGVLELAGGAFILIPQIRYTGSVLLVIATIVTTYMPLAAGMYLLVPLPFFLLAFSIDLSWMTRPKFIIRAMCRIPILKNRDECSHVV